MERQHLKTCRIEHFSIVQARLWWMHPVSRSLLRKIPLMWTHRVLLITQGNLFLRSLLSFYHLKMARVWWEVRGKLLGKARMSLIAPPESALNLLLSTAIETSTAPWRVMVLRRILSVSRMQSSWRQSIIENRAEPPNVQVFLKLSKEAAASHLQAHRAVWLYLNYSLINLVTTCQQRAT